MVKVENMTSNILNKIFFWMLLLLSRWQQIKKDQYLPLWKETNLLIDLI
jgi:hypothetical protein